MANAGSLLGQLLGAALSGGSVRGAGNAGASGGIGDILGQVLGGGRGGAGPQGGGGGIEDILGQVLGGGGASGRAGGGGSGSGLPGGLDDILGQVLGGGRQGGGTGGAGAPQGLPGGLGDILGQILGGGAPSGSGRAGGSAGGDLGDFASDALGGDRSAPSSDTYRAPPTFPGQAPAPSPAPAPAPSPARRSGGGGNDLMKYGGLAVIGMLAWNAFRKWQSQAGARSAFTSGTPDAAGFSPAAAPGGADAFSGVLLAAMAAAAQSDGALDQEELERIGGGLARIGAAQPAREDLIDVLTTPVDPQQVVDAATSPEAALQIYAASVMAIRADSPVEQRYLAGLAQALGIDPGLKAQVDADLGA